LYTASELSSFKSLFRVGSERTAERSEVVSEAEEPRKLGVLGKYSAQVSTLYLISPWFETQFEL
jgi:hypothetical protein